MTTNANLPAMKKMSEVRSDGYGNFVSSNETMVIKSSSEPYLKNTLNQINHADALADALDNLMRSNGGGKKDCGHDFCCTCAWDKAKAALATYRGEA